MGQEVHKVSSESHVRSFHRSHNPQNKTINSSLHLLLFFSPPDQDFNGNKLIKLKHVSRCKPAAWKEETKFLIRVNDSSINEFYMIRNSYDKK